MTGGWGQTLGMGGHRALIAALALACASACGGSTAREPGGDPPLPEGWLAAWGGDQTTQFEALAVSDDTIFVGGTFIGTTDFDPGPEEHAITADSNDINEPSGYVTTFARDGTWIETFPSLSPAALGPTQDGGAYILGKHGSLLGDDTVFLQRLDTTGVPVWSKKWDYCSVFFSGDLLVHPDASVAASFRFRGSTTLDPDNASSTLASNGEADVAVVAFAPDGHFQWGTTFGGVGDDSGGSIASRPDGGLVVTGTVSDPSAPLPFPATHGYLARLDPAGNQLWAREWGGDTSTEAYWVVTASDGTIFLLEGCSAWDAVEVDLDPGPAEALFPVGPAGSAFITSFDEDGDFRWAQVVDHLVWELQVDSDDTLLLTQSCAFGDDLDPGPATVPCIGGFALKRLDRNGKLLSVHQHEVDFDSWFPSRVRRSGTNQLVVAGQFGDSATPENAFAPVSTVPAKQGTFAATIYLSAE